MIGDNGGEVFGWIGPDFVAAFALSFELAAQCPEFTRELLIGHAGTIKETRAGMGIAVKCDGNVIYHNHADG